MHRKRHVVFVLGLLINLYLNSFASAQLMYFTTGNYHLVEYNMDTQAVTDRGLMGLSGGVAHLNDIACSPNGELFGMEANQNLVRIDRVTGQSQLIGLVGKGGTGLAFTPDGRLWTVGSPGMTTGSALFEVDPQTALATWVTDLDSDPAGDIGFNPVDHLFYMAAYGNWATDLRRLNTATGTSVIAATFGNNAIWGSDFTSRGQEVLGGSSSGALIRLNKTATGWSSTALQATIPGGVYGATKYHCQVRSDFLINGLPDSVVERHCGEEAIVDGSQNGSVIRYQWEVTGANPQGQPVVVKVPASGNGAAGNPGILNFNQDPAFAALALHQNRSAGNWVHVKLTTWCDLYEPCSVTEKTVLVKPYAFSWSMNPDQESIAVFDSTSFQDTGSESVVSRKWLLDGVLVSEQPALNHTWQTSEGGNHTVTYQVNHLNGCVSESSRAFKVQQSDFFVPNAFTPNGDGLNDLFKPVFPASHDFERTELTIINKWGQSVFVSTDIDQLGWDGVARGEMQPEGVYVYVLRKWRAGVETSTTGRFTLLR